MNLVQLKQCLQTAGVVGAGGAGFPTHLKLATGADTLLINAAECEPLLYTDYFLLKQHLDEVIMGAQLVMQAAGMKIGYLGIKKHTAARLSLAHGQALSDHIFVHLLPDVYPMGDEIILIYQVLGRVVTPGNLPLSAGVLVFNVETLYNVKHAADGESVTEKWLTVGGKTPVAYVGKVPVGTPVAGLLSHLGMDVPADCVVMAGGPAMGKVIDHTTELVTKTTKGLLILPKDIPAVAGKCNETRAVMAHATANCCSCTLCTELCPRALIGYPLQPHKIVRSSLSVVAQSPWAFTEAALCSGCGICEFTACCQGISPMRVYAQVKGILAKNKIRYQPKAPAPVDEDREFRLLPVDRLSMRLGVASFDKLPTGIIERVDNT